MKILVVGSGGREHALVWKLRQSPHAERLFAAPGNAGTAELGENVGIAAADIAGLTKFAKENSIDFTVVGPDDTLAAGIVDSFTENKLRIFGPTKSAAQLEASKIFAKKLMREMRIPTARAETFRSSADALRHCDTIDFPAVIKADGLARGKGVIIAPDRETARAAVQASMEEQRFGNAGSAIVIEEFLEGPECSLHALVDGNNYKILATARDHKRAFDGDSGPNTGGMGAVSPAELWNPELEHKFDVEIMEPLMNGLKSRSIQFRGLLFPGLMNTSDGLRVLEFNCRFGDPETQSILPRLESDLLELLIATTEGRLSDIEVKWDARPAVTVVMVSGGYPDKYETGKPVTGLTDASSLTDVYVFHAGTKMIGNEIVTSGGRVLAVTALGSDIADARRKAYAAVEKISFEGSRYRSDIASA